MPLPNLVTLGLARLGALKATTATLNSVNGSTAKFDRVWTGDGEGIRVRKYTIATLTSGETDTGLDLEVGEELLDVQVNIRTAEATASTKLISVGTLGSDSGNATGFIWSLTTASALLMRGVNSGASRTLGALLYEDTRTSAGSNAFVRKTHMSWENASRSLSYSLHSAHTELVGDIFFITRKIT